MTSSRPPKAVLFDIGGVVVVSPMQAIHDYEDAYGIPHNWVNFAIARSSARADGAWQRVERGAMPLDATFFRDFHADLHDFGAWRAFCTKQGISPIPALPQMDVTTLFWAMMFISRAADPTMSAALAALRESRRFVVGALSNTVAFPAWHPLAESLDEHGGIRSRFDVFVSSAHVGVRKPHREAYEYAVRELDRYSREQGQGPISAKDIVFLDDIGQNLRTAKELGMRTIKVNLGKTKQAVEELEAITGMKLSGVEAKARL